MKRPVGIGLALVLLAGSALAQAPSNLEDCEGRLADHPDEARSYNCFGIVGRNPAYAAEAIARLEGMIAVSPEDPRPRLGLGLGLMFRDSKRAAELFEEAAGIADAAGDPGLEGWARWGLMMSYGSRGMEEESHREWIRAEALALEAGEPTLIANVVIEGARTAGLVRSELSQGYHALRRLEAEPFFESLPARTRLQHFISSGQIATRLGAFARAFRYGEECVRLSEASSDRKKLREGLSVMAQAALLGPVPGVDRQETIAIARRSLDLALEQRSISGEVETRWTLARLLDGEASWEQLRLLEQLTHQSPWVGHMRRQVEKEIGTRLMREEPPRGEEALSHFQFALEEALRSGSLQVVASSLVDLVLVRLQLGDRDEALGVGMRAMDAIERLEDLQSDTSQGARLLATRSGIYYRLADRLLEDGDPDSLDRAFEIGERMRTRRLIHEREAPTRVDPKVLREIARVQSRLMAPDLAKDQVAGLEAELYALESQAENAAGVIGRTFLEPPSSVEIGATLGNDEALLSYLVPPDRSQRCWLWVQTAEDRRVYALPTAAEVDAAARFWLGLIEQNDPDEAEAAAALHRMLVEQALAELPADVTKLIVVPDGILHRVPFEALRASVDALPWIARFDTTIAPSARFWLSLRSETTPVAARALLLADPQRGESARVPAAWRDVTSLRGRLGALPHARGEARAAFRSLGRNGRLEVGESATEALVKQAVRDRYGLMHFATHAVIDEDVPDRSAVLLAAGNDDEDGLLQAREVRQLDLDGSVVVLSGCRSAAGAIHAGEGVMGLARSFFSAHARTVVGGLWPLADRDTSELMQAFYRRVGAGEPVAQALAGAKRERFEAGAATASWAGVVVLGNGDAAFPAVRRRIPRWLLPVAGAMLVVLFVAYRRLVCNLSPSPHA